MNRSMRGAILRGWVVMLCLVVAIAGLSAALWVLGKGPPSDKGGSLVLYCAAGIRPPVEAVLEEYKKVYGVSVQAQYDSTGNLLSKLQLAKSGDLFIVADESYLRLAKEKGLMAETIPLAMQRPVIAVKKGNPKKIARLADLRRPDVKTACATEGAAIGQTVKDLMTKSGEWEEFASSVRRSGVFKGTVNDVANDVKLGTVDAGIVWDSLINNTFYPELEAIRDPLLETVAEPVTIGVVKFTQQPTRALKLARYLAAADKGQRVFKQMGYTPVYGDVWAERPEIVFFSGAVNKPAVDETLKAFERREGVRVSCVFNGCGILVSSMKVDGVRPDAYLTCDASFATPVADLLDGDPLPVSETTIGILVPKGNPKGIQELADLAREGGLRVGVANPEQSTLGTLTQRLLSEAGLVGKVMANVGPQTPTADMLVNQLKTGSLDAAVVYEANASHSRDKCDFIPITSTGAVAVQTFSVGKSSKHKQLVGRLLEAIASEKSRATYEKAGFRWKGKQHALQAERAE